MGISSCGTSTSSCGDKSNCATVDGCSKTSVYDWLSDIEAPSFDKYNIYEIRFKNGARKGFYKNVDNLDIYVGDHVVVESSFGYDIGTISLSGELVKIQLKKRRLREDDKLERILRIASPRELELQQEAREKEKETMLKARVLARNLGLEMKLGDVEYQADGKKATFYYTANQRVDFRQLIKDLAKEFRVKIEMRQIGARQEAALVGGISPCGRELCSTTWMNSFKSVNTSAARYQNLSINQTKLSGLCGRLKCCLNFELDSYLDALKDFPKKADYIETKEGSCKLVKTDILKGLMYYISPNNSTFYPLTIEKVKHILDLNKKGIKPESLSGQVEIVDQEVETLEFVDVVGQISVGTLDKSERKRKRNKRPKRRRPQQKDTDQTTDSKQPTQSNEKTDGSSDTPQNKGRGRGGARSRGSRRGPKRDGDKKE